MIQKKGSFTLKVLAHLLAAVLLGILLSVAAVSFIMYRILVINSAEQNLKSQLLYSEDKINMLVKNAQGTAFKLADDEGFKQHSQMLLSAEEYTTEYEISHQIIHEVLDTLNCGIVSSLSILRNEDGVRIASSTREREMKSFAEAEFFPKGELLDVSFVPSYIDPESYRYAMALNIPLLNVQGNRKALLTMQIDLERLKEYFVTGTAPDERPLLYLLSKEGMIMKLSPVEGARSRTDISAQKLRQVIKQPQEMSTPMQSTTDNDYFIIHKPVENLGMTLVIAQESHEVM